MKPPVDYSLYLVTDRDLMRSPSLEEAVEQAVLGGCTVVQLREKTATSAEFYRLALAVKEITDRHRVPLIINDRADIALAVDAAGVHVGQSDLPPEAVRKIVGPHRIVGVSTGTLAEARAAVAAGADYLGVGAMFPTGTKTDADSASLATLRSIRAAVGVPVVVIGGINAQTLPQFKGTGIDGAAVVSAILAQPDIRRAAARLREEFDRLRES